MQLPESADHCNAPVFVTPASLHPLPPATPTASAMPRARSVNEAQDAQALPATGHGAAAAAVTQEPHFAMPTLPPSSSTPGVRQDMPQPSDEMAAMAVDIIPEAEITVGEQLGRGGFGAVLRGQWGTQKVALKQMHFGEGEDLRWEVNRLASVRHPNVVRFHGLCRKNGETYLVMELCGQGSMADALKRSGIDDARLWQWMLEITQGLACLHAQGMLHRDLKAANLLIDSEGRAKLADLGVAQVDALLEQAELNAVSVGAQTPQFMAPECLDRATGGHRHSSKETDIYALGTVFWQMVTRGSDPDGWDDVRAADPELRAMAAGARPRMPIPDSCPAAMRELILSCWRFDPRQRATIAQVLQQLHEMGPQLHPDHALRRLIQHLDAAMHDKSEDVQRYVPSRVTERPVQGDMERYWAVWDKHGDAASTAPTSTTQALPNVSTTTAAAPTSTASMPQNEDSIIPDAAAISMATANPPVELKGIWDAFIEAPDSGALLLLGAGGLGKTLAIHVLVGSLLRQWRLHLADPKQHPRPAFFPLLLSAHADRWDEAALKDAYPKLMQRHAVTWGATQPLVIVDAYDECRIETNASANLARHLGLPDAAKMVISCRADTVPEERWIERFAHRGRLQTCHFLPFTTEQMLTHLQCQLRWNAGTTDEYRARLEQAPELRAVLRNPFVLSLFWQSWPTQMQTPLRELNRSRIYAGFMTHMVNAQRHLLTESVQAQLQAGHSSLADSFHDHAQQVALLACQRKDMSLAAEERSATSSAWRRMDQLVRQDARQRYAIREAGAMRLSEAERREHGRRIVLGSEDYERLQLQAAARLISALPLRERGSRIEFIHQSIFEHCAAQRLLRWLREDDIDGSANAVRTLLKWIAETYPEILMFVAELLQAEQRGSGLVDEETMHLTLTPWQQHAQALLLYWIGYVAKEQQRYAEALNYYLKALAMLERALDSGNADIAACCNSIGVALDKQGRFAEALAYHRRALTLREELPGGIYRADTAISYNNIGVTLSDQGKFDEALDFHYKALVIQQMVLGGGNADTAHSFNGIGAVFQKQGKLEDGLKYYREALDIREKVLGTEHADTAASYNNIGSVLQKQGKLDEALDHYRKALAISEKALGTEHVDTAHFHSNLGTVLLEQGKHAQALAYLRKALEIREKVLKIEHADTALSHHNIGATLKRQGRLDQALWHHRKALEMREKVLGVNHAETASSHSNIGSLLNGQGKHAEALEHHHQALKIRKHVLGTEHAETAMSYNDIGLALHGQGNPEKALKYLRQAVEIQQKMLGTEHAHTAASYRNLGTVLRSLGKQEKALEYFQKALACNVKLHGVDHADTASAYHNLASMLYEHDKLDEALDCHRKALEIKKQILGTNHISTANSYHGIGVTLDSQGKLDEALEYHHKARTIREEVLGTEHADTAMLYNDIGVVLTKQGKPREALKYHRKALAILQKTFGDSYIHTRATVSLIAEIESAEESLEPPAVQNQ